MSKAPLESQAQGTSLFMSAVIKVALQHGLVIYIQYAGEAKLYI